MAEIQSKDIVVLKNNNETIVYPKTTAEAVFVATGEDLQIFLNNLHNALNYNIVPETTETISLGNSSHKFVNIYVVNVYASNIEASSVKASTIQATTYFSGKLNGSLAGNVTGDLTGNVNSKGTGKEVWGAVFN